MIGLRLHVVYIVYVVLLFGACKESKTDYSNIDTVPKYLETFSERGLLKSEVFIDDSINLFAPFTISIVDDILLVSDDNLDNNKLVQVFDLKNKKFLGNILNRGKGPNEFLSVRLCDYKSDTILFLSVDKKQAVLYSLDKIRNLDEEPDRIIDFQVLSEGDFIERCFLYSNKIIAVGQFKVGRYHFLDLNGKHLGYFGEYPKIDFSGKCDNYHLGFVYGPNDYIVGIEDRMVCVNRKSLTSYKFHSKTKKFSEKLNVQWDIPFVGEVGYQNGRSYVIQEFQGNMIGAGTVQDNGKHIFFPYSKYDFSLFVKPWSHDEYEYICEVDFNGMPVKLWELDKPIKFPLAIDKARGFLYTVHTNEQSGLSEILRFPIK